MATPLQDATFQPGCYVFGFTTPGQGYFGNARSYPQQAIFGARAFGGEIAGLNIEAEIFNFRYGAPVPRATGLWPTTPTLSIRRSGPWAKRLIFCRRRGYQIVRRYTPADGAPKECLVPSMLRFIDALALWKTLTNEAKCRLHDDALTRKQAHRAHTYFTKLYIENDPRWHDYV